MKPVTDINTAQQLPERGNYDMVQERQPDGTILNLPVLRALIAVDYDPAAIMLFIDRDGRLMTVDYDSEGPYKREMSK